MTKYVYALLTLCMMLLALSGCAKDREIIIDASSYAFNCGEGDTMWFGYLDQYYVEGRGCNGGGQAVDYAYSGLPKSPTIFRWKALKWIPGKKGTSESRRFFYAETYEPIDIPPRPGDHQLYEVYLSMGPRLLFSESAIPEGTPNVKAIDWGNGHTAYRIGDMDTLYYFVRSRPRLKPQQGILPQVETMPYRFHPIKGIELSEAQYLAIACERTITGKQCARYLKEDTPGLTEEQLSYLRAARRNAPHSRDEKQ